MRYVNKKSAPELFQQWMELENEDWQPSYGDLQNPQKHALHESLLSEQGWTCCYCGQSIDFDSSHIEHFRPQESHENLALHYGNLFVSCGRKFEVTTPSHCGHAKSNQFDEHLHISPLDQTCETRFLYTLDGQICANDPADAGADYMTSLLKLDIPFLRNRREEVIKRVFDEDFMSTATNESLLELSRAFRALDKEGRADDLGHVVARFAEQQATG
ncbi:TIGR02646 family protein [Variovorax sp. CAN2819]|uniref:retron system putative HNH endonuclease n=1 Tax=Variovorax sp. CAN15 TaxID=3046727 RepID=UPI0026472EB6|nr:retron system putative HNH endonuclease [Variovorax sp. CAN15]MDN6884472.1 TIGR02646 family protein [Variovorax sp. CAN15]